MRQVVITIDADANTEVKVRGVAGGLCKKLTKEIEKAIGVTSHDAVTPEFFAGASQSGNQTAAHVANQTAKAGH